MWLEFMLQLRNHNMEKPIEPSLDPLAYGIY